jgi:hypothetical protein
MAELRLGDDVDDFCPKCKRLTNHSIVSLVDAKPAKVRCRTCYHEQIFRDGVPPPSKKDLKKAELFNEVLSGIPGAAPTEEAPVATAEESAPKKGRGHK